MTTAQPPLDPRKNPWKRGDVFTLDSKNKSGFVLAHTPEYMEVLWMPESIVERLTGATAESVLRVAHADSLTARGDGTNLAALETVVALNNIENAVHERMKSINSEAEEKEVNELIKRSFQPQCAFDRKYSTMLITLALKPDEVSWCWKLRELLHRVVHHH